MRIAQKALCAGLMAAAVAGTGRGEEPSSDPAPTVKELLGAWSGNMTHEGESQPLALELAPAEEGRVSLRLTLPAMHLARQPLGVLEPQLAGDTLTLGPFVFTYDREARTLSGTMPAALVPVYEIPVVLRPVDAVEASTRREPDAPVVEPVWSVDTGAPLWAGASFAGGVIYAGDDEGRLHALDASSGQEQWSFAAGAPIRTRATIAGGAVFFQADNGILYRLAAESGDEVWRAKVVETAIERLPPIDPESRYDSFGSDVTLAGGRLYLGTFDGRLIALDPADGTMLWEYSTNGSILAAPEVSSGRIFVGSFDGHIHALDAATGARLWKKDTKGAVLSTPAVAGENLVVGNRSYDLLALNAESGDVAWKQYIWFSWVESSATVRDGVVYVGSSDAAAVFAFDARTGERLWKTDVYGWAWGQPAVADERVFVGTAALRGYQNDVHHGGVMALDLATGRVVWRYVLEPPAEGAWGFPGSPAVGAGLVFVTGLDGRVLAFAQ
jgi:outer membrane protein assembly factor BamB